MTTTTDDAVTKDPLSAVVLHVPHAVTLIPKAVLADFVINAESLRREVDRITDHYTDELFRLPEEVATTIAYPVSRLVADPERFEDDAQESMAAVGFGAVYMNRTDLGPLRRPLSNEEREARLDEFYRPHHQRLTSAVRAALDLWGKCLIIDCHSFSAAPLLYEPDQTPERPDYCVGTDEWHTPPDLVEAACRSLRAAGRSVEVDRPYGGAIVPMEFYRKDRRVASVMIEVNRRLYLDPPDSPTKSDGFTQTRHEVSECLRQSVLAFGG